MEINFWEKRNNKIIKISFTGMDSICLLVMWKLIHVLHRINQALFSNEEQIEISNFKTQHCKCYKFNFCIKWRQLMLMKYASQQSTKIFVVLKKENQK